MESAENLQNVEAIQNYKDLSNDILVNQYMADAGHPVNPDAEILDDVEYQLQKKTAKYGVLIK